MPHQSNPDPSPNDRTSGASPRDNASDLAKQITSGARAASSAEEFEVLSEKLRKLADLLKPVDVTPVVKGQLDPSKDSAIVLPSRDRSMVSSIAFDSIDSKIAVMGQSGELDVYSATEKDASGQAILLYSNAIKGFCLCDRLEITPAGNEVAIRGIAKNYANNYLSVVSLTDYGWFGRPKVSLLCGKQFPVIDHSLSPDGSLIAVACHDNKIRLLEGTPGKRRGQVLCELPVMASPVTVGFSVDGTSLFVKDRGPRGEVGLYLLDVVRPAGAPPELRISSNGKLTVGIESGPRGIVPSPDHSRIAVATDRAVEIYGVATTTRDPLYRMSLEPLSTLKDIESPVSLTFSKDGRTFACADSSAKVTIRDLSPLDRDEDPVELAYYRSRSWVTELRFSSDGGSLAVGTQSGSVVTLSLGRR